MKILFCGDIVGRSGRQSALINIPKLKQEHNLDFIIANVDNASGGFGVNENNSKDFIEIGVDVLTGGDHIWDKKEMLNYITREKRILRPLNFPKSSPGTGKCKDQAMAEFSVERPTGRSGMPLPNQI